MCVCMNVILRAWRDCKCFKHFPQWLFFHGIILRPDYNALLFSAFVCVFVCVFMFVCVRLCRYNGSLPNGDRGRRKSRFALYKRPKANGVKPSTVHVACSPQAAKVKKKNPHAHTKCTCTRSTVSFSPHRDHTSALIEAQRKYKCFN